MRRNDHLSLRQSAIVTGICWVSGIVFGSATFAAVELPPGWWPMIPLYLPMAAVIALPYAVIAGLLGCITLLVADTSRFRNTSSGWRIALGAICGAAVGALHPLSLLGALVDYMVLGAHMELPVSFLAACTVSGAIAGAIVGWWHLAWPPAHPGETSVHAA